MSDELLELRAPARMIAGGLLLAVNRSAILAVTSGWDKKTRQQFLRLHLSNNLLVSVNEEDAEGVLEALGLERYLDEGWVLDLERDV